MMFKKRPALVALWLNDRRWLMSMSIAEVVGTITLLSGVGLYLWVLFTSR